MTFLPIVERGLRVAARQRGTYRLRLIVAAALMGIWLLLSGVAPQSGRPVQRARAVFTALTVVGLGFAMLAGVFLTADCLSEERREGTLGLLFLTDLKGHDVVLGKLAATSLHAFYGLLAGMPLLALPLLTGGMTAGEFWRMTLVLGVTLFLSLSVGLGISALSRESRTAMGGTLLVMVGLAGFLPALFWLHKLIGTPFGFVLWPSPAYAYRYAFDANYSGYYGAREFWASILVMAGLGAAFLVAAMILLPLVWQERGRWGRAETPQSRGHRARFGSERFRAARRELLDANPFFWLATRDRWLGRRMLVVLFILISVWLGFYFATFSSNTTSKRMGFSVAMLMAYGLHQFLKCWIAVEASRRISEDRQSGALEVLLVTPLDPKQIVTAQRKAVWRAYSVPVFALVMVNTAMIWLMLGPNPIGMSGKSLPTFLAIFLGGIVLLLLDVYALVRVAMWSALTARRHNRAILASIGRVMLPSWLAVLFFVFLTMIGGIRSREIGDALISFWLLGSAILAIVNASWAARKLNQAFRAAAALGHGNVAGVREISSAVVAKLSPT